VTKFAEGAWVSIVVVALIVIGGSRIRRHYAMVHRALALRPVADEVPQPIPAPGSGNGRPVPQPTARDTETEESPEAIRHLAVVPVRTIDLASMRALAYAGSLGQPVLAVHISPRGRRPTASSTTGGPGVTTCRSKLSSPPTARSSLHSCATSRRFTVSARTSR